MYVDTRCLFSINAYIDLVADDFLLNHHYTIKFDRKLTYKGDLHERHLTKQ
jgi:hypothetical protein